jgi:hypothetical protein
MLRRFLCLAALALLAACGTTAEPTWAPEEAVQAARYVHGGPPSITLFTVTSTTNGSGAHAGLLINGSQRVMFDPAGTWHHPRLPERNDVHYGMTPKMVNFYIDYHARETFDVQEHTIVVPPEVAERAIRLVQDYGAVPKAQCTVAVSRILRQLPGFENLPQTWFPKALMRDFAQLPGVSARTITDSDADNNHGVLLVQAGDPRLE